MPTLLRFVLRGMSSRSHDGVEASLALVLSNVNKATLRRSQVLGSETTKCPTVVAVSKTKPLALLQQAYNCGQRHFGENYVQEFVQKAEAFEKDGVKDIKWHFIGHLQRNKANQLCGVPDLYMVHTVDSIKLSDALNKAWERQRRDRPLHIMVQVNTSSEESKSGCSMADCSSVASHVSNKCPQLRFAGLMTIGSLEHSCNNAGANPDFERLTNCKRQIVEDLQLDSNQVALSMGMSSDYEAAIVAGADYVRVGSSIFGVRM